MYLEPAGNDRHRPRHCRLRPSGCPHLRLTTIGSLSSCVGVQHAVCSTPVSTGREYFPLCVPPPVRVSVHREQRWLFVRLVCGEILCCRDPSIAARCRPSLHCTLIGLTFFFIFLPSSCALRSSWPPSRSTPQYGHQHSLSGSS